MRKVRRAKRWRPNVASRDVKIIQLVVRKTVFRLMTPSSFFPCLIEWLHALYKLACYQLYGTRIHLNRWMVFYRLPLIILLYIYKIRLWIWKIHTRKKKTDSVGVPQQKIIGSDVVMKWRFALPMGNCCCVSRCRLETWQNAEWRGKAGRGRRINTAREIR